MNPARALARGWRKLLLQLPGFPCPLCGSDAVEAPNDLCADCLEQLPLIHAPRCPGCGGRLDGALALCGKCLDLPVRPWEKATALFELRDSGRTLVLRFKNGSPELARPLARLALPWVIEGDFKPDWLVAVPLHFTRQWHRGYNQSALIAAELSRLTGIPAVPLLKRTRRSGHQASRDRHGRLAAMRGVFQAVPGFDPGGRKILLIDDVLTTGATLAAAAQSIPNARIRVLTLARR